MKLIKSKLANVNYLAKIVNIQTFTAHPNADALKCAHVDGYTIIVGIDELPGQFIYFPTSCEINPEFLAFANLYRHNTKNSNPEAKCGFFEDNGRVKAIRLRGVVSEGFLLPTGFLESFIQESVNISVDLRGRSGTEFDTVEHNGKEFWICRKYLVPTTIKYHNRNQKRIIKFNRAIDTQFRFHYDTIQVKKEPWCISPDDLIQLTYKIHGTSGISAHVLTKVPNNIFNKIKYWLLGEGWSDYRIKYDYLYASRSVIKNLDYSKNSGYYGCDVWEQADKIVRPHLPKGYTAYYEIVGFLPNGGYIQKDYDYGCVPPEEGEDYTEGKHFKVRIYRITETNVDGIVHEFSAREVQQWCKNNYLTPVEECYYGLAGDLYPELYQDINGGRMYVPNWNEAFWEMLANDSDFYMEQNSPECNNKVPHEGLVIKKEDMLSHAWKLKCFAFINGEAKLLDSGETNIEDEN